MKRIPDNIINILAAATITGNVLALNGQLDPKDYIDVNKVLDALGGKWNRKAQGHVFPDDVSEMIEQVIQTGEYTRTKQDFGQFDTPEVLATDAAEMADITAGMRVLEPSAGIGNLALAAIELGAIVRTIEIDPARAAELTIRLSKSKLPAAPGADGIFGDFLAIEPEATFDRVLMNPPFAKQDDIKHVLHAFKFLKPGGKLVAIMSAGTKFRENTAARDFRSFVAARKGTITDLPDGSFLYSGTAVRTVVVTMES